MRRRRFLGSSVGLLGGGLLSSQRVYPAETVKAVQHHSRTVSVITEAAKRFLGVLDPKQKERVVLAFKEPERTNWGPHPGGRDWGLMLGDMNPYQKHLAHALLAAGLSQEGYIKAVTIMSLQEVLAWNADEYFFSIFGTPSDSGTWGYRVEGHHLSQNYTIVNGQAVDGPSFFGALPLEFNKGPRKGERTLGPEEDLGFETLRALDEPMLKVAIVDPNAFKDISTIYSRTVALKGQPSGLSASKMGGKSFDALRALVEVYVRNVPDDMAQRRLDHIDKAGRDVWFSWAGGTKPGGSHYYRVQTKTFLLEFDNLDPTGSHVHSLWRDLEGDWGGDLLEAHYQKNHRTEKAV